MIKKYILQLKKANTTEGNPNAYLTNNIEDFKTMLNYLFEHYDNKDLVNINVKFNVKDIK